MQDIILKKFHEWTRGTAPAAVGVFDGIRDIPFAVVNGLYDPVDGPAAMLEMNRGFCVPKHYLLGIMYEELGIKVKYCVYSFRWSDMPLPGALNKTAAHLPDTLHLSCKALLAGKWLTVDATWDRPLKKKGFPVNDAWDGEKDAACAVKPLDEHACETGKECARLIKDKMDRYTLPEKLSLARFSADLNKWLESVRVG